MENLCDYDFYLPKELIATKPIKQRENSRLLALSKNLKKPVHDNFLNIENHLIEGDLLVINNTKVMKARLVARKESGGKVEILLVRKLNDNLWTSLIYGKGNLVGQKLALENNTEVLVLEKVPDEPGLYLIEADACLLQHINSFGQLPLPPYFAREADEQDLQSYQTIFAKDENLGAVAAPTAGLHFSPAILAQLERKHIKLCELTLHVGPGTFLPVRTENINEHKMHREFFSLSESAACKLNQARHEKRRIVAVGTTSMRTLEHCLKEAFDKGETEFTPQAGSTDIFIKPGFKFLACDALITNFHTPKSTLLMLVAAAIGYENMMMVYQEAVAQKYRFFSYGDACYFDIRNKYGQ